MPAHWEDRTMTTTEAKAYWDSLSTAQQQALIAYAKAQAESGRTCNCRSQYT